MRHSATGAFLDVADDAVAVQGPRREREQDEQDVGFQGQAVGRIGSPGHELRVL